MRRVKRLCSRQSRLSKKACSATWFSLSGQPTTSRSSTPARSGSWTASASTTPAVRLARRPETTSLSGVPGANDPATSDGSKWRASRRSATRWSPRRSKVNRTISPALRMAGSTVMMPSFSSCASKSLSARPPEGKMPSAMASASSYGIAPVSGSASVRASSTRRGIRWRAMRFMRRSTADVTAST